MRYLTTLIYLTLALSISVCADWPPTIDGHEIFDNSVPTVKLETQGTREAVVFGTIEVEHLFVTDISGVTIEVDLSDYTRKDGTHKPVADWDFNGYAVTNLGTLECNKISALTTIECHTLKARTLEVGTTSALVWYEESTGKLFFKDGNVEVNLTDLDIEITGKMTKVTAPVPGNFVGLTAGGDASDSGVGASDYYTKADLYTSSEVDTAIGNAISNANLDDLNDVNVGTPSDGQVLTWDNLSTEWIATTISAGTNTSEVESIIDSYSYNSTEVYTKTEGDNRYQQYNRADVIVTCAASGADFSNIHTAIDYVAARGGGTIVCIGQIAFTPASRDVSNITFRGQNSDLAVGTTLFWSSGAGGWYGSNVKFEDIVIYCCNASSGSLYTASGDNYIELNNVGYITGGAGATGNAISCGGHECTVICHNVKKWGGSYPLTLNDSSATIYGFDKSDIHCTTPSNLYLDAGSTLSGGTPSATTYVDNATKVTYSGTVTGDNVKAAIDQLNTDKADKVSGAVEDNFASLDAAGNLIDSGYNHLSFATQTIEITDAYYVDSVNGSDVTGSGAINKPYQTIQACLDMLSTEITTANWYRLRVVRPAPGIYTEEITVPAGRIQFEGSFIINGNINLVSSGAKQDTAIDPLTASHTDRMRHTVRFDGGAGFESSNYDGGIYINGDVRASSSHDDSYNTKEFWIRNGFINGTITPNNDVDNPTACSGSFNCYLLNCVINEDIHSPVSGSIYLYLNGTRVKGDIESHPEGTATWGSIYFGSCSDSSIRSINLSHNDFNVYTSTRVSFVDVRVEAASTLTASSAKTLRVDPHTAYQLMKNSPTLTNVSLELLDDSQYVRYSGTVTGTNVKAAIDQLDTDKADTSSVPTVLNDLSNVNVSAPNDGESLVWKDVPGEWTSEAISMDTSFYRTYYVAPNGNDTTGDGSFSNPWATPGKLWTAIGQPTSAAEYQYRFRAYFAPGEYTLVGTEIVPYRSIQHLVGGCTFTGNVTQEIADEYEYGVSSSLFRAVASFHGQAFGNNNHPAKQTGFIITGNLHLQIESGKTGSTTHDRIVTNTYITGNLSEGASTGTSVTYLHNCRIGGSVTGTSYYFQEVNNCRFMGTDFDANYIVNIRDCQFSSDEWGANNTIEVTCNNFDSGSAANFVDCYFRKTEFNLAAPKTVYFDTTSYHSYLNGAVVTGSALTADQRVSIALDGISDVNAPSPNDNDVLSWDDGTSKWISVAPSGGSSYLQTVEVWVSDGSGSYVLENTPDGQVIVIYENTVWQFPYVNYTVLGNTVTIVGGTTSGDNFLFSYIYH